MIAVKIIGFILLALVFPIGFMVINGHFVGKKAAPKFVSSSVVFVSFLLLLLPIFEFAMRLIRTGEILDFLYAAFVAGAALTGIISMQEIKRYEDGAKVGDE